MKKIFLAISILLSSAAYSQTSNSIAENKAIDNAPKTEMVDYSRVDKTIDINSASSMNYHLGQKQKKDPWDRAQDNMQVKNIVLGGMFLALTTFFFINLIKVSKGG